MISNQLRKNDVQKIVLFVFDVCRIVQERVKNIMTTIISDGDRWVSDTWRYFHSPTQPNTSHVGVTM